MAANDHADWAWDERVLRTLANLSIALRGLEQRLVTVPPRFGGYGDRFAGALAQVDRGQRKYVDEPGLDSDAAGYLLKDAGPDDILDGIRAVARGESPIHPRAARELLVTRRPSEDMPDLTRESGRCSRSCARASPTSRSPGGSASPSAPSRRTSPRSSPPSA
jgi:hypothetical protein